jgi:2Fe-2S ferredoxin
MYKITVFTGMNDALPAVLKGVAEGETLLEVLLRNKVNIRHDCGGVCYCTTCHIYIEKGETFVDKASKREEDFLKKVAHRKPTSRLACQCLLLEGAGEIELRLPNAE